MTMIGEKCDRRVTMNGGRVTMRGEKGAHE